MNKKNFIDSVVVLIVMINTILTMLGWNPIPYSEEEIYIGISSIATVASTMYIWWKNNKLKTQVVETEAKMKLVEDRAKSAEEEISNLKKTVFNLGEIIADGNKEKK